MDSLVLLFSLCFPMLGGQDLLDHIPSDVYWKAKGIVITGEAMLVHLQSEETKVDASERIKQLGDADFATREEATQALIVAGAPVRAALEEASQSDDPEVAARARRILLHLKQGVREGSVRRLMAIRALGELRHAAAIPALKELTTSKEPEVARYALRAIASIEKGASATPKPLTPSAEQLAADLKLLPASSIAVGQVALHERLVMPLKAVVEFQPLFKRIPGKVDRSPIYFDKLLALADELGNVRIDSATCGMTFNPEGRSHLVCILRGACDWNALKPLLLNAEFRLDSIAGREFAVKESELIVLPLAEDRWLVVFTDSLESVPLKEIVAGVDHPRLLPHNEKMWRLVGRVNQRQPVWAALIAPPIFADVPWLAALDTATAELVQQGTEASITIRADTAKPEKLKPTMEAFEKGLEHTQNEAEQLATIIAAVKPVADFVLSLEFKTREKEVTFTGKTPDVSPLFALPLVLTSGEWCQP